MKIYFRIKKMNSSKYNFNLITYLESHRFDYDGKRSKEKFVLPEIIPTFLNFSFKPFDSL
jgi:hypothetical protein